MERELAANGNGNGNGDDGQVVIRVSTEKAHEVVLPPPRSTLAKLKLKAKETFFPDDPFRHFKGRIPLGTKCVLAVQYLLPVLSWAPAYTMSDLKSDLVSGLTIASLAIPQGISYAKLANLPPIIGLYSSFVPPLVYSVLGSSRDLAVGPVSIASLIMGSMLRQVANPNTDGILFLRLAFTSTLFAGIFQASLGVLRLGFIIDFLSKATLIGFMAGAAVIVSLQQLKSLLGIVHFTKQMGLVSVMSSVFHKTDEWSWQTIVMGICFLILLLVARHVSMKKPKLFWVSAGAPLACVIISTLLVFLFKAQDNGISISMKKPKLFWVSAGAPLACVIISTLLVFLFKAQDNGISIIGKLKCGLNRPSWDKLILDRSYLATVIKTGLVTGLISLTEGVAVGRTFAALRDYKVDGNKEMMAIGIMNIVGSCTSCYVTTGAFSRSAVNHNAGCKTAMSNIVMALTVMVTLLFLMPLFVYTPNVVLGTIIITAVVGLIDVPAAYHIWKMDKMDFLVCLCAFLGVVFVSVEEGLAIAVGLSIFRILLQITRPKTVILGNIAGTNIYRNVHHYRDAMRVPGFLIVAVEAPINFANATYLNERFARLIEEEKLEEKKMGLRFLILDLSVVSAVDTSGISFLMDLKRSMAKRSIEVIFVNPVGEVMEKLQRADDIHKFLGGGSLFLTIEEAIFSLSSSSSLKGST